MKIAGVDFGKPGFVIVSAGRPGGKTKALADYVEKLKKFYPQERVIVVKPAKTVDGSRG